jgi:hypothetical protein
MLRRSENAPGSPRSSGESLRQVRGTLGNYLTVRTRWTYIAPVVIREEQCPKPSTCKAHSTC